MIYTPTTKKAMKLCFDAHKEQVDQSGLPYVFHPFHLAEQMTDEDTTIVALLHDVVEDTDYTFADLEAMGFSEPVVNAIRAMTRLEGVPYMEYVAKIKDDPIARQVKLADLRHNSDLSRLDAVDQKALDRAEKYRAAMALLEAANSVHSVLRERNIQTLVQFSAIVRIDLDAERIIQRVKCENMGGLFEIHPIDGGYILYGEGEIFRYDLNLNRVWEFRGRDIFSLPTGDKAFWLEDGMIHCRDWEGWHYVLDPDGTLIHEQQESGN